MTASAQEFIIYGNANIIIYSSTAVSCKYYKPESHFQSPIWRISRNLGHLLNKQQQNALLLIVHIIKINSRHLPSKRSTIIYERFEPLQACVETHCLHLPTQLLEYCIHNIHILEIWIWIMNVVQVLVMFMYTEHSQSPLISHHQLLSPQSHLTQLLLIREDNSRLSRLLQCSPVCQSWDGWHVSCAGLASGDQIMIKIDMQTWPTQPSSKLKQFLVQPSENLSTFSTWSNDCLSRELC